MFVKNERLNLVLNLIHQQNLSMSQKISEQADRIVSRIDWMKEERKIYDERTLYLKVYSSFLATIEKEKKDVVIQAITEGIAEG